MSSLAGQTHLKPTLELAQPCHSPSDPVLTTQLPGTQRTRAYVPCLLRNEVKGHRLCALDYSPTGGSSVALWFLAGTSSSSI